VQPKQVRASGSGRQQEPVAALPPEIAEKIGDTQLYRIAGLSTDAERLAVAQIVADGSLPARSVRLEWHGRGDSCEDNRLQALSTSIRKFRNV
jgi:hypothetical protein